MVRGLKRFQHSKKYHADKDKHGNFIKDTKEFFAVAYFTASKCFNDPETVVMVAYQCDDQHDLDPNPNLA